MTRDRLQIAVLALLLAAGAAPVHAEIWQDVTRADSQLLQRIAGPDAGGRLYRADLAALHAALAEAPDGTSGRRDYRLALPMPHGALETFIVAEASILAPALAAKYPDIKSYRVYGADGSPASGRISMTSDGLQAMIFTSRGRVFITRADPASSDPVYRAVYTADAGSGAFHCGVEGHARDLGEWVKPDAKRASRVAGNLLQYDIAIAVTLEYHALLGGDTGTTNEIAAALTAINAIYERDLGITLQLVSDESIYETTDGGLDNDDVLTLVGQVDNWIDSNLPGGDAAYDIGHMFSRPALGSSGVAKLGAVCDSSVKASGVSGSSVPLGSAFYIDLVAHEIGHQFNAEHSFNGTSATCLDNRNAATAVEPGSGSTIMSYAGICPGENLQANSDATFHARSIAQIDAFTAAGGSCSTLVANGNTDPAVGAVADRTIPALTPFLLDASATDADADPLQYQWDQMDTGCATDSASFGTDNGSNPLFRSQAPRNESRRHFPALGTQLSGRFDKAEVMACHDRALDFRVTVRDGQSGQATEDVRISVDAASGPFQVTSPNSGTLFAGSAFTVTWDVADSNLAPVNCANVDIDLLAFSPSPGYATYSEHSLASGVANSGSRSVVFLPSTASHDPVRIRVKCSDNIFYDISNGDLVLQPNITPSTSLDFDDFNTRFWSNTSITGTSAPACGAIATCTGPSGGGGSGGGNGDASAIDFRWLMLMAGLLGLAAIRRAYGLQ